MRRSGRGSGELGGTAVPGSRPALGLAGAGGHAARRRRGSYRVEQAAEPVQIPEVAGILRQIPELEAVGGVKEELLVPRTVCDVVEPLAED